MNVNYKDQKETVALPVAIGFLMLSLTYVGAFVAIIDGGPAARVGGWVFVAGKGCVLLSTILGVMRSPRWGWKLFVGRYVYDWHRPRRAVVQALARFGWEMPQLWLGYMVSQWRVLTGRIDGVQYLGGVTFVVDQERHDGMSMGLSLGCFVNIWISDAVEADFEKQVRYRSGQLFMHEFGHTVDSLRWGWLYLLVVGIPSYLSQVAELVTHGRHQHQHLYAERWANKNAEHYFDIAMRDLTPKK